MLGGSWRRNTVALENPHALTVSFTLKYESTAVNALLMNA
jgi:hypothetical protein